MLKYAKMFGLSEEDVLSMYEEQKGKCAICGKKPGENHNLDWLVLDHDHKSGKARAFLCNNCNLGLGNLKDDITILRKAIAYLKTYS